MQTTKFRRLRRDELEEVRPQFIKFLAVNGIDGPSWEQIKVNDPAKTDQLLLQFSQIVFSGVIEKVEFLIQRSKQDLRTYHCLADKIIMNGLMIEGETDLDLSDATASPQAMIEQLQKSGASVKLYSGERAYRGEKDQDIFLLMEQGALISEGQMFSTLEKLKG